MFPFVQLGSVSLQVSGLIIIVGLWTGLTLTEKYSKKFMENSNDIYNLVLITLIAGLVGARLGFVVTYSQDFASNPLSVLSLNPGLLDFLSGSITGLTAGYIFARRKRLPAWKTLDSLTPLFAVMVIASGVSHLATGVAYGNPTGLPWGIFLWGAIRHPTQIYEIISGFVILGFVLYIEPRRLPSVPETGIQFFTFLALFALSQLLIEGFRGDSIIIIYGLRRAQIFAWFVLALSLWGLNLRVAQGKNQTPVSEGGPTNGR